MTLILLLLAIAFIFALPYLLMLAAALLPYVLAIMAASWLLHACC